MAGIFLEVGDLQGLLEEQGRQRACESRGPEPHVTSSPHQSKSINQEYPPFSINRPSRVNVNMILTDHTKNKKF